MPSQGGADGPVAHAEDGLLGLLHHLLGLFGGGVGLGDDPAGALDELPQEGPVPDDLGVVGGGGHPGDAGHEFADVLRPPHGFELPLAVQPLGRAHQIRGQPLEAHALDGPEDPLVDGKGEVLRGR